MRWERGLSRFLLLLARDARLVRTASFAEIRERSVLMRFFGKGNLLRFRRILFRQISGNLGADGRRQDRRCQGQWRKHDSSRRFGLLAAFGRKVVAQRRSDERPSRSRSAG